SVSAIIMAREALMTTNDLRGRVALVTGGSRGIGAAIVRALADAGAAVIINYREQKAAAETLAAAIGSAGGRAVAIRADISHSDEVAQLFARADAQFGPVDILVNNAGIALGRSID